MKKKPQGKCHAAGSAAGMPPKGGSKPPPKPKS
jgi:hypothetical protein